MRKILPLFALLIAGCAARPARAQFLGYTSPQTVTQTQTITSCVGNNQVFPINNIGQSVHYVTFQETGNNPITVFMFSGQPAGPNQISNAVTGIQGTVTGTGSYPFFGVFVECPASGAGDVTINYSGTSVSPGNLVGQADESSYDFTFARAAPANTTVTYGVSPTLQGNSAGNLLFEYNATGPSGSTLAVNGITINGTAVTLATYSLATGTALQSFPVPSGLYPTLQIIFTSGGASAATYTLEFVEAKNGAQPFPQCEKTAIINTTTATALQQIAAPSGQTIRICSISISSGTAEGVDFQQGTGTNCGTGNAQATGVFHMAANSPVIQTFPGGGLVLTPNNALCSHLSAGNQTDGTITYSLY